MAETRLSRKFDALREANRAALIAYITAGDPTPAHSVPLCLALERGGADILELGVPFSDPIADGPVIQRASERALHAGTNVAKVLEIAAGVREESEIPIILFSYLNPLLRYGFERMARDAKAAGVDGCLLTDVSVEEAGNYVNALREQGLDAIFLVAPTSTDERLKKVAGFGSGFVYVVSRTGVTGEQASVAGSVKPLVDRLRKFTKLPLAVGFGVSQPEHVAEIGRYADGVVVGSAFMRFIEDHADAPDLASLLETFTRTLSAGRGGRPA
jgi:tryptophan synthase alpha chain